MISMIRVFGAAPSFLALSLPLGMMALFSHTYVTTPGMASSILLFMAMGLLMLANSIFMLWPCPYTPQQIVSAVNDRWMTADEVGNALRTQHGKRPNFRFQDVLCHLMRQGLIEGKPDPVRKIVVGRQCAVPLYHFRHVPLASA